MCIKDRCIGDLGVHLDAVRLACKVILRQSEAMLVVRNQHCQHVCRPEEAWCAASTDWSNGSPLLLTGPIEVSCYGQQKPLREGTSSSLHYSCFIVSRCAQDLGVHSDAVRLASKVILRQRLCEGDLCPPRDCRARCNRMHLERGCNAASVQTHNAF